MKFEDWTLREFVSALLAFLLVGFAVWLMVKIALLPADAKDPVYQRLSNLLQAAIGLAGTATGYYFGRVPAEKSAAAARATASDAQKLLADATQNANQNLVSIDRLTTANRTASEQLRELKKVVTGTTPLGGGPEGSGTRQETISRIDRALEALK